MDRFLGIGESNAITINRRIPIKTLRIIHAAILFILCASSFSFAQSDAELCASLAADERFAEALAPCERAAKAGDATAQGYMGLIHANGEVVPQSSKTALEWWLKAAAQGNIQSQFSAGLLYWQVDGAIAGIPKDRIKAYAWLSIAAQNGFAYAVSGKQAIAGEMTPAEVEKGDALAKEYLKKYPKAKIGDGHSALSVPADQIIALKGGNFEMGDPNGDPDEAPHTVIMKDFQIDKYEVTREDYRKVTGIDPSFFAANGDCPTCPVENVSWNEAEAYCKAVGKRLPTEEEWEYAARSGGKRERWAGVNDESQLEDYAWTRKNSGGKTHPVGEKKPNGAGLYDMTGNVSEWVVDLFVDEYNGKGVAASANARRMVRGGCWIQKADELRTTYRESGRGETRNGLLGFRCAR